MSAPVRDPETGAVDLQALLAAPAAMLQGNCSRGHGHFRAMTLMVDGDQTKPRCPRCDEEQRREASSEQARLIEAEREEIQRRKRLEKIGLPERMVPKRYVDFVAPTPTAEKHLAVVKAYASDWKQTRDGGANLILCGKPGTGKTHLASIACKHIASEHRAQPLYTTTTRMLRHIRGSYSKTAEYSEEEAVSRFAYCDLLVLDEVGVKLASDNDRSLLFEIIDERYQQLRPTILISNLTVGEIAQQTDERLVDRLIENGQVLLFDWPSHRGQAS